jgi:hypothetical protein
MPTELKFQVSLLSQVGGGGWVGKLGIKANSAQLELELGLSLAISEDLCKNLGTELCANIRECRQRSKFNVEGETEVAGSGNE